jgi:hypothetical protein
MKCAFDRIYQCAALTHKECVGCRFRKTQEELDEGRERAEDRIMSLPDDVQDRIAKK